MTMRTLTPEERTKFSKIFDGKIQPRLIAIMEIEDVILWCRNLWNESPEKTLKRCKEWI